MYYTSNIDIYIKRTVFQITWVLGIVIANFLRFIFRYVFVNWINSHMQISSLAIETALPSEIYSSLLFVFIIARPLHLTSRGLPRPISLLEFFVIVALHFERIKRMIEII